MEKYDRPCQFWDDAEFMARLSRRERECLLLRASGAPVLNIPPLMGITWRTVWGYRISTWRKYITYQAERAERSRAKWHNRSMTG